MTRTGTGACAIPDPPSRKIPHVLIESPGPARKKVREQQVQFSRKYTPEPGVGLARFWVPGQRRIECLNQGTGGPFDGETLQAGARGPEGFPRALRLRLLRCKR